MKGLVIDVVMIPANVLDANPYRFSAHASKNWYEVAVRSVNRPGDRVIGHRLAESSTEVRIWAHQMATSGRLSQVANSNVIGAGRSVLPVKKKEPRPEDQRLQVRASTCSTPSNVIPFRRPNKSAISQIYVGDLSQ